MDVHKQIQDGFPAFNNYPYELQRKIDQRLSYLRNELEFLNTLAQDIILEIGCGHGHYLLSYAQAHPKTYCIGLDLLQKRIQLAQKKQIRANISTIKFLQGDAFEFLRCLPSNVKFSKIFILFPDPWPKRKHAQRRLISDKLLNQLKSHTQLDSSICIRTDNIQYMDTIKYCLQNHSDWTIDSKKPWDFESYSYFQNLKQSYSSIIATRVEI